MTNAAVLAELCRYFLFPQYYVCVLCLCVCLCTICMYQQKPEVGVGSSGTWVTRQLWQLASHWQRSACLYLSSTKIKGLHHYPLLHVSIIFWKTTDPKNSAIAIEAKRVASQARCLTTQTLWEESQHSAGGDGRIKSSRSFPSCIANSRPIWATRDCLNNKQRNKKPRVLAHL